MLKYIEQQKGKWHYGEELRESNEAKAERLIAEALRAGQMGEPMFGTLHKGHPFKLALAEKLRADTTMTIEWIAQRLNMGSRGHLAHLLCRHKAGRRSALATQPSLGI